MGQGYGAHLSGAFQPSEFIKTESLECHYSEVLVSRSRKLYWRLIKFVGSPSKISTQLHKIDSSIDYIIIRNLGGWWVERLRASPSLNPSLSSGLKERVHF
jgi:hypothetical protein